MLNVKERIGIIRLSQKIDKNPIYAEKIGVSVERKNILFQQLEFDLVRRQNDNSPNVH